MQKTKGKYVLDVIDGVIYSTDDWAMYNLYNKMFFEDVCPDKIIPEPKGKKIVNKNLWTFNGEIVQIKKWTLEAMIEEYKKLMWKYQFKEDKMKQLTEELRKIEARLKNG